MRGEALGALVLVAAAGGAALVAGLAPHPLPAEPAPLHLSSLSVTLPDDLGERAPPGRHAELFERTCTACHSAAMVTRQPALTAAQWQATIVKMREVYKAPVPPSDEPALIAYFGELSRRTIR